MTDVVHTSQTRESREKQSTSLEHRTVERPEGERSETTEMPAGAQVMMSTPNFYRLEIAYSELPYYNAALTPALDIRNGFYHVSNTLGPGHELNPDYIAAGPDNSLID